MMHVDPRRRLIAIIQRCIWAPLAAIEKLGQLSKDDQKDPKKGPERPPQPLVTKEISEKLGESKDKCEPILMAIREYAINVRVIIP